MRPIPDWLPGWVKPWEGLHDADPSTDILEPKRDPIGLWTVGWGHLVTRDRFAARPAPITMAEAERLLAADLRAAARSVERLIRADISGKQYGALIDFAYNVGAGALQVSTLRKIVNRGDLDQAPAQFMRWVYAGGTKLPGLVRRRAAEADLFAITQ